VKYRRKVLTGQIEVDLKKIIQEVAHETQSIVLEMEVQPDHVHLLVDVDPQFGIGAFMAKVKGRSSRYLRAEYPQLKTRLPGLWTHSYFVATVGGAPLEVIKQYIQDQKAV
jgi:putative transposase